MIPYLALTVPGVLIQGWIGICIQLLGLTLFAIGAFLSMDIPTGFVSVGGPVEEVNGKLVLRIPLDVGGGELAKYAKEISTVEDGHLVVAIHPVLAEQLAIGPRSQVIVDTETGKFRMTRNDPWPFEEA